MKKTEQKTNQLFVSLINKATLKQDVYMNTLNALKMIKVGMEGLHIEYKNLELEKAKKIPFVYKDRGEFEAELKFGGDTLVFMMHTNVFEFPRDHEVMKTAYIQKDKNRSFCGIINVFNFLSDSFKYNRLNDSGYLIGRIFINKDNHYFIEGKREMGYLYTNFGSSKLSAKNVCEILESAINYTINFDLLTPPYDQLKEVSVMGFKEATDAMQLKTAKRLGFKFQADMD
jgi:hypothetical protein